MFEGEEIVDARIRAMDRNRRGGIIVFSTDVNSISGKNFTDAVNNWFKTNRKNRLAINSLAPGATQAGARGTKSSGSVDDVVFGWSIGNFFKDQYVGPNGVYDEKSKAIELLDVSDEVLEEIGTQIARALNQREVLIKSHNSGDILVVDKEEQGPYQKVDPADNWD